MRALCAVILLGAAFVAGCAGLPQTPYNGELACQSVGGRYTGDGRCLAGNS